MELRKRKQQWGNPRKMWFLWDPPGMVIAGFAWCLMLSSLVALWVSISRWVGVFSLLGFVEALWFTSLLGMCMWCHFAVLTTNPGVVPAKLSGILPDAKQDGDAAAESEEESELEEVEVDMPLNEFENRDDDGTLLVFCDECDIYRPSR